MEVTVTHDPPTAAARAASFLRAERYSANVLAVELTRILDEGRPVRDGSTWLVVEEGAAAVGAAMHTPPFNLNLPRMPEPVVDALAQVLGERRAAFPGVNGEVATVEHFLRHWEASGGSSARQRVAMRLYVLDALEPPVGVPGASRRATRDDTARVEAWLAAFHHEAMPDVPLDQATRTASSKIDAGHVWLWETESDVVSLAGTTPAAAGVARIGPVYTPPDRRRHGFGAAITARATQAALDAGAEDVVLYTNLANPTSNAIYQAIGYRPDHDAAEWDFV